MTSRRLIVSSILVIAALGLTSAIVRSPFLAIEQPSLDSVTKRIVMINDSRFEVEVVSDPLDKARGLSNRDHLPRRQGMLFVFSPAEEAVFWMKDMRFSIDLIWMRDDTIVGIERGLPVPAFGSGHDIPRYSSPGLVDYALEVNAGESYNLTIGDSVRFLTLNSR